MELRRGQPNHNQSVRPRRGTYGYDPSGGARSVLLMSLRSIILVRNRLVITLSLIGLMGSIVFVHSRVIRFRATSHLQFLGKDWGRDGDFIEVDQSSWGNHYGQRGRFEFRRDILLKTLSEEETMSRISRVRSRVESYGTTVQVWSLGEVEFTDFPEVGHVIWIRFEHEIEPPLLDRLLH
jgi:hypothetical protein